MNRLAGLTRSFPHRPRRNYRGHPVGASIGSKPTGMKDRRWRSRLCAPVHALPIDLFRILAGLLSCAYFASAFIEANDISGPHGLVDHRLSLELFPYTKWSLLQGEMPTVLLKAVFLGAVAVSAALAAGYRPALSAAVLYVVAVSTYRLNFLVLYVDDAIFHWTLLWLILLPTGRTLTWRAWRREGKTAMDRWRSRTVPGLPLRCFLVNLALVYAASGLWKLTSPMWLEGTALYVILKLPIAWFPDLWDAAALPWLKAASYGALAAEPFFVLLLFLRPGHPVKWLAIALLIVFHAGIITTLKIPFANFACLAGAVLWCRHEIMAVIGRRECSSRRDRSSRWDRRISRGSSSSVTVPGVAAVVITGLLGMQAVLDFAKPQWRYDDWQVAPPVSVHRAWIDSLHRAVYGALWVGGLAQSYRLLDWVDSRNYSLDYRVRELRPNGSWNEVDPEPLFPASMRSILLQSYLHGVVWRKFPPAKEIELRAGLRQRFAARFCGDRPEEELVVEVDVRIGRITASGPPIESDAYDPVMRFTCRGGSARLKEIE